MLYVRKDVLHCLGEGGRDQTDKDTERLTMVKQAQGKREIQKKEREIDSQRQREI